jgi:hypothetical protein
MERLLGCAQGDQGETLYIPADDWIEEILVYISKIKINGEYPNRSHNTSTQDKEALSASFIEGLKVFFIASHA